ncbi:MAG: glycosyl transferase [Candidatus Pelethousia sp.]|nr:glycosyl transferase [Candidatus Pelethousia sp.]
MKFGAFDDLQKEYVIHTPHTPLPWINYLGNDGFFSLISNTGGGYAFYQDAKLRRITRYRYQGVPLDVGSRFYYIVDGETRWSPGYLPCKTPLDAYRCRHGLGYTAIESAKNGVEASLTFFVPLSENCEINRMRLTNATAQEKRLKLFAAVEWCLWNAVDDAQNFQRNLNVGEVEVEDGAIYHKTEYRERRDHYAFFSVNAPTEGFDTDRDAFLGPMGDWGAPKAVLAGRSGNSLASGWSPIASHELEITLAPGESKTLLFILGYAENPRDQKWAAPGVINKTAARAMQARFAADADAQAALDKLKEYWEGLLGRLALQSGNAAFDRMVNLWHPYQCMVTFNLSRSASYFESGTGRGMGFRDSCQDLLGFVHMVPERARVRILDIAAVQFKDGSTYHQYQPLTKQGNGDVGTGFNDDPLWLVAAVAAYVRETGDAGILEEPVPFDNEPGSEATLFEHLRRSVGYTLANLGPHGLPLIGRADWNDCLNLNCFSEEPGESFQTCANFESGKAESVFIAAMFVLYGREYAQLCRRYGEAAEGEEIEAAVYRMEQAVKKHAWDGAWFLRAYDAFSRPVGSKSCEEGQIYIEPQGFCAMAGIGVEEGMARSALDSVWARLVGPYGIELLSPCYTAYHPELGEITSYPPGYKENGGIFCHNNPWVSIGEAMLGNGDAAFAAYSRICPAFTEENSDVHRTEPYIYSQMIAGREAARCGEAKNSWLTGTASWAFVNASQYLLGIRPQFDGLEIRPCLPKEFEGFTASRLFRGVRYNIRARRAGLDTPRVKVNGVEIEGCVVPPVQGAGHCEVEVLF